MSSPSVTTALLWTLLSAWSSFAAAFVVVIRNESDSPVIPCVQQANGELQVFDPAGALPPIDKSIRATPSDGNSKRFDQVGAELSAAPEPPTRMSPAPEYPLLYERVYNNCNPWLRSSLMTAAEGPPPHPQPAFP